MAGTSDLDRQIEQLRRCEYIKEAEVKALCAKAREILVEESNVQRVDAPVTVRASPPSASARWPRRKTHLFEISVLQLAARARVCLAFRRNIIYICVDSPWKLRRVAGACRSRQLRALSPSPTHARVHQ